MIVALYIPIVLMIVVMLLDKVGAIGLFVDAWTRLRRKPTKQDEPAQLSPVPPTPAPPPKRYPNEVHKWIRANAIQPIAPTCPACREPLRRNSRYCARCGRAA